MNILQKMLGGYSWLKELKRSQKKWIEQTREFFRDFLDETDFPDPDRTGDRGPTFQDPEWLIMFIAVLSVKLKVKTYVQIHKMATEYWDLIVKDLDLKAISERQLRMLIKNLFYLKLFLLH
jgi:hypothetical protein